MEDYHFYVQYLITNLETLFFPTLKTRKLRLRDLQQLARGPS